MMRLLQYGDIFFNFAGGSLIFNYSDNMQTYIVDQ